MIVSVMDIASMVHAIVVPVGLVMTVPKKFAPMIALVMVNALMPLAFARQPSLGSIARC
jgi:hypothetical protein